MQYKKSRVVDLSLQHMTFHTERQIDRICIRTRAVLVCLYLAPFQDNTTSKVYMTACDVENSFTFDNKA